MAQAATVKLGARVCFSAPKSPTPAHCSKEDDVNTTMKNLIGLFVVLFALGACESQHSTSKPIVADNNTPSNNGDNNTPSNNGDNNTPSNNDNNTPTNNENNPNNPPVRPKEVPNHLTPSSVGPVVVGGEASSSRFKLRFGVRATTSADTAVH